MTDTTPAEAEATADTIEFEHFDRKWSVPSKSRLSHLRHLRRDPSNVGLVDAYLSPADIEALDEIDPDEDELDKFTDAMMAAMGYKNAGNS